MFSPPYGDGTMLSIIDKAYPVFSPPYGDCTKSCAIWLDGRLLSPPLRGLYYFRSKATL